jgi:hypothetical protein
MAALPGHRRGVSAAAPPHQVSRSRGRSFLEDGVQPFALSQVRGTPRTPMPGACETAKLPRSPHQRPSAIASRDSAACRARIRRRAPQAVSVITNSETHAPAPQRPKIRGLRLGQPVHRNCAASIHAYPDQDLNLSLYRRQRLRRRCSSPHGRSERSLFGRRMRRRLMDDARGKA